MGSNNGFLIVLVMAVAVFQETFMAPVQTITLTKSTPVVLGQGTLLTCSWSGITGVDFLQYTLESNEAVYTYEPGFTNEGAGILINATGWSGTDAFYVYINVTEEQHLTSYQCGVSDENLDDYVSPFISLIDPETTTVQQTTSTAIETTTTTHAETTTTTAAITTTPVETTTTSASTTTIPVETTTAAITTTTPVETTTPSATTTTIPIETTTSATTTTTSVETTTATTTTTTPVKPSIGMTSSTPMPTTLTTTTTSTGTDATVLMDTTTREEDNPNNDKQAGNNDAVTGVFPGWAIALCVIVALAWVVTAAYLVYHHTTKDKVSVAPTDVTV